MTVQPKIESLQQKTIVGMRMRLNFANFAVGSLWARFMPRCATVKNRIGKELFSLAVYPENFSFSKGGFNAEIYFERWAGVEVESPKDMPDEMESLVVPAGLYAIFHYKGLNTDTSIYEYIHGEWLPGSPYVLDTRPHFELLGEKYRNGDPNSEEDIYIPVRLRN